jgi:hypothetical protein
MTVTIQGLSGGSVAGLLGVRRTRKGGALILGANPLAVHLGSVMARGGHDVFLVDSNADDCLAAEHAGRKVLHANGLEDRALVRAHADERERCIAATTNESVNVPRPMPGWSPMAGTPLRPTVASGHRLGDPGGRGS